MKQRLKTLGWGFALTLGLAQSVAAKETVVIGELSWDGARAVQTVLQVIIEDRLGVDTEIMAVDQGVMFKAMDKGDGSLDILPDLWIPAQADKWDKYIAKGSQETVLVNDKPYSGSEGFFIPGYIQDQYGVTSVQDLAKPEIAKLFDTDGDGKGEYWPGGTGWGVTNSMLVKAKSYGFDRYFTSLQVSDSVIKAQLKTAFRKKKAILFYYWTPEWIHAEYDLRKLEEPVFDGYAMESMKHSPKYNPHGCWKMYQPKEDDNWLENSSIRCASEPTVVSVAYSKSLEQRTPRVARFLKQVQFDAGTVNGWILKIAKEKEDPLEVVREWINNNPETVNGWLDGV